VKYPNQKIGKIQKIKIFKYQKHFFESVMLKKWNQLVGIANGNGILSI
jgi:hypothetical protein